jgi:hypothetical protein
MKIHTPDDLVITESMARGHRRVHENSVIEKIRRLTPRSLPKRFGPHVRAMVGILKSIYGEQHLVQVNSEKREASFIVIEHVKDLDHYIAHIFGFFKRGGAIQDATIRLPFKFTSHFVERHIQLKSTHHQDYIASIARDLFLEFQSEHEMVKSSDPESGKEAVWKRTGPFGLATKTLLILGQVPKRGDAIVKTVIHKTKLEEKNRELWLHLRRCKKHLKIRDPA